MELLRRRQRDSSQQRHLPRSRPSVFPSSARILQEALPRQQQLGALRIAVSDLRQLLERVRHKLPVFLSLHQP